MELFGSNFKLVNMKGRPVFIRELGDADLYPNIKRSLTCADCPNPAKFIVYELGEPSWMWCGECDIGG